MKDEQFFRSVGGIPIVSGTGDDEWYFGWIPRNGAVEAYLNGELLITFEDAAGELTGSGADTTVLLYNAARRTWNRDLDLEPQRIGDCVGWGYSDCVDLLACIEFLAGEPEQFSWDLRTCTEAVYALSRVEYGRYRGSYNDGSYGRWAANAVNKGGTLSRSRLGNYNWQRAREWGANGLPDNLEPEARLHRIRKIALIRKFEEARDAIANGYPVAVCSSQGFSLVRDRDGFAHPQGTWHHCMKFIASRDDKRPGLLCMNSWGPSSPTGPKGDYDIPDGSFWVDASVCTTMLRSTMDSYALSNFDGYPRRDLMIKELIV